MDYIVALKQRGRVANTWDDGRNENPEHQRKHNRDSCQILHWDPKPKPEHGVGTSAQQQGSGAWPMGKVTRVRSMTKELKKLWAFELHLQK